MEIEPHTPGTQCSTPPNVERTTGSESCLEEDSQNLKQQASQIEIGAEARTSIVSTPTDRDISGTISTAGRSFVRFSPLAKKKGQRAKSTSSIRPTRGELSKSHLWEPVSPTRLFTTSLDVSPSRSVKGLNSEEKTLSGRTTSIEKLLDSAIEVPRKIQEGDELKLEKLEER